MKFLFLTEPDDGHAVTVKLALEEAGHSVRLLFMGDQPTKLKNSVHIDNKHYSWKSADDISTYECNNYDVVWGRRPRKPYIPTQDVHEDDYKFIVRENTSFYESITNNLAPNAWWINSKEAATRANSKLYQLRIAVNCGLQIPITLCSNDPIEIRYFLLKHECDGVIYKPFATNLWCENKFIKISYTNKIDFLSLPSNNVLQMTPGIFQREIKKKYELRITCFGNYLVAAKINSQSQDDTKLDWRSGQVDTLAVTPYSMPAILEEKIKLFMRKMGLVFGCIDIIVDEFDNYIFLEVNEQGQFLWKEGYNTEFKMLDIFIKFLLNKSPHFTWDDSRIIYQSDFYDNEVGVLLKNNMEKHVCINYTAMNSN